MPKYDVWFNEDTSRSSVFFSMEALRTELARRRLTAREVVVTDHHGRRVHTDEIETEDR